MNFDLAGYLNKSVEGLVRDALKSSLRNPKETAFLLQYIKHAKKAVEIRENYERQCIHIPPFLIASITGSCNLFCKGCYARENKICGEDSDQIQLSAER